MKSLIDHMNSTHNKNATIAILPFENLHSFLVWKKSIEAETNSLYVQNCSTQTSGTTKRWYYYCSRSGVYKAKGEGSRNLKLQGSNKIGFACTAHIKVVQNTFTGKVNVEHCETHTHPTQLGHLPLPEETRVLVAQKLKDGVTIDSILDTLRDSVGDTLTRRDLICKQDIRNIKRQYNI